MMKLQLGDKSGLTAEELEYVERCKVSMRNVTKKAVKQLNRIII